MKKIIVLTATTLISATPLCAQDIPLAQILVEKEDWREVAKNLLGPKGGLLPPDPKNPPKITFLKSQPDGSVFIYQDRGQGPGLTTCLNADGTIDKEIPIGDTFRGRHQALATVERGLYTIEPDKKSLFYASESGRGSGKFSLPGFRSLSCLTLWPDEGHLVIGETDGAYLWTVRIERDGSFGPGDRYYSLRTRPDVKMHVSAMTMDAKYLLYACTPIGIQVFDPTGRLSGVIAPPSKAAIAAITIGGAKADELFVAVGDRVYARKIQGKAAYTLKKAK